MHEIHALIDAELVTIGEKFYLRALREQLKGLVSDQVPVNSNLSVKGGFIKIHLFYFLIKSDFYNFKIAYTKVYKKRMRFFKSGRYIAYINTKLLRERGS